MQTSDADNFAKSISNLVSAAIPENQSPKEEDFDYYVEDLQDEIIHYFNNHVLNEVPALIDRMIALANNGANTDDKRKRYTASVIISTLLSLFPFDDYLPQFLPTIELLLHPGFRKLVIVGARVVGNIGTLSGPNRDHFLHVLVEKNSKILNDASKNRPDHLFAAAAILKEISTTAPDQIFKHSPKFYQTILSGLSVSDANVRDLCIEMIEVLLNSRSASVGLLFLTDFLAQLRQASIKRFSELQSTNDIITNLKMLLILLKSHPYMSTEDVEQSILPICTQHIKSSIFEIMCHSIEVLLFLCTSETIQMESDQIKPIFEQLLTSAQKANNAPKLESIILQVISAFPKYANDNMTHIIQCCKQIIASTPKNTGPIFVFHVAVSLIKVVGHNKNLFKDLQDLIDKVLTESTVPTPIHLLLQALNESHLGWDIQYFRYKQYLIRLIHEELTEPCQRWESIVISLNAIDQLHNLSYPDAIMLHSLVLHYIDSTDWQVRERVAYSAIHCFEGFVERIPLESMIKLVDLAVDDPVKSVRKKSILAFTKEVYKYIEQPEIIDKFARLIHDECFVVRKMSIDILGKVIHPATSSILRDMLLATLRQLPDKYNPIIPPRVSDVFPHLIWASHSFIHLYADAIFQRFNKMLDERFNNTVFKDQTLIYMNSAQLRDIDGSLIKSLSRLNELCPDIVKAGPLIDTLSSILSKPVHPWTKVHALKALKNIVQGSSDVSILIKEHPQFMDVLMKIIKKNSPHKLIKKALKVLGALGCSQLPTQVMNKKKDIFIFRSFFTSTHQFNLYSVRLIFDYLFNLFKEPMIDQKKETIARVISDVFHADPECIAQYINAFLHVFLPSFSEKQVTQFFPNTIRSFLKHLSSVIEVAGRLIVPYAIDIYKAIESLWRQQYTLESTCVIRELIKATYGQCDSILHLVVPVCFQLIKFKGQNAAFEIFKLLQVASEYTPSYLTTIIQGIDDLAADPQTNDRIIGSCLKTLTFIVKSCDCIEHLSTIKRCVMKLRNNAGGKYREAALDLLHAIDQRRRDDENDFDFDEDDQQVRPSAPVLSSSDADDILDYLSLPTSVKDDEEISQWYRRLERHILQVATSPILRALSPLLEFTGLLPHFSFTLAFLSIWLNTTDKQRAKLADLLTDILKCDFLPSWVTKQFMDLIEFSVLSEIDLRIKPITLIPFAENHKEWSKALLFLETSPPIFPGQKEIGLYAAVHEDLQAIALSKHGVFMDHELWMQLGDWDKALEQISKTVDPSRFTYNQVVSMANLEDWEGILSIKDRFNELEQDDRVRIAKYFMTAELWSGHTEEAMTYMNETNGFSAADQIMRAIVLIKNSNFTAAKKAIEDGWRYLAASVSAIEKYNKNHIQHELFQAQELLELSEVMDCIKNPDIISSTDAVWRGRLKLMEESPDLQKEIFKIRALVPGLPHFDAHMLDNISYFIWLGKPHIAKRLCDVFFPNAESDYAKYVNLELSGREEKIEEMLQLAQTCHSSELRSRLHELVGNIKLKTASTVEQLQNVANHYNEAAKSQEKIANVSIMIALSLLLTSPAISTKPKNKKLLTSNSKSVNETTKDINSSQDFEPDQLYQHSTESEDDLYSQVKTEVSSILQESQPFESDDPTNFKDTDSLQDSGNSNSNLPQRTSSTKFNSYTDYSSSEDEIEQQILDFAEEEESNEDESGDEDLEISQPSYQFALKAAEALGKSALKKPWKNTLFTAQLLSLLTHFGQSKSVASTIRRALLSLPPNILATFFYPCFILLLHSCQKISDVAMEVCTKLTSNFPQYVGFQILQLEKIHSDNSNFEDLYDKMQMESPIIFSQVSAIYSELLKIANPFHMKFGQAVSQAAQYLKSGNMEDAFRILKQYNPLSASSSMCVFDKQIEQQFERDLTRVYSSIYRNETVKNSDIEKLQSIANQMKQRYDSVRVIRLSSVSARLERPGQWIIPVPGRNSLNPNGVQIDKFFHSIGNTESMLQIMILGRDGKRYNYKLKKMERERAVPLSQFVDMLGTLVENASTLPLKQGSVIQLSQSLFLCEVPKNQNSMLEMITFYQQSKQRIINAEQQMISAWKFKPYGQLQLHERKEVLNRLRNEFDCTELWHALLVTLKDADAWIRRTSNFAQSLGTLSCVTYIIGTVDQSPAEFFIDKTNGSVTFSSYVGKEPKQHVPFRLTPMVVKALGKCGIGGPFTQCFVNAMKEIRKRGKAMAPILQFAARNGPYEPPALPAKFKQSLGVPMDEDKNEKQQNDPKRKDSSELDELYNRIVGDNKSFDEELAYLVEQAQSIDNLVYMNSSWYPWW